jgi:hypothetical protein
VADRWSVSGLVTIGGNFLLTGGVLARQREPHRSCGLSRSDLPLVIAGLEPAIDRIERFGFLLDAPIEPAITTRNAMRGV